jgi:hypothetical protein
MEIERLQTEHDINTATEHIGDLYKHVDSWKRFSRFPLLYCPKRDIQLLFYCLIRPFFFILQPKMLPEHFEIFPKSFFHLHFCHVDQTPEYLNHDVAELLVGEKQRLLFPEKSKQFSDHEVKQYFFSKYGNLHGKIP